MHTLIHHINETIEYILCTKRFDESLFHSSLENPMGFFFHLYNVKNMPMLIEDKTVIQDVLSHNTLYIILILVD